MNIILRWIIGAVALYLTVQAAHFFHISGLSINSSADGAVSALGVILVLTLVNAFVRPIILFLFAGLNCLTLGLFSVVVNALMFMLAWYIAKELHLGFHVDGFIPALFGSIVLSVISGILGLFLPEPKDKRTRSRNE